MVIFDSNVWIALFLPHDSLHEKALELINTMDEQEILIPEYVWLEVATLLTQKGDKKTADAFLEKIRNTEGIRPVYMNPEFSSKVMDYFLVSDKKMLSFVDHALLMFATEISVYTFDKALQKCLNV